MYAICPNCQKNKSIKYIKMKNILLRRLVIFIVVAIFVIMSVFYISNNGLFGGAKEEEGVRINEVPPNHSGSDVGSDAGSESESYAKSKMKHKLEAEEMQSFFKLDSGVLKKIVEEYEGEDEIPDCFESNDDEQERIVEIFEEKTEERVLDIHENKIEVRIEEVEGNDGKCCDHDNKEEN